jgi:hypothetical protein
MKGTKNDRKGKNKVMERTDMERLQKSWLTRSFKPMRPEAKMNLTMQ